METKSVDFKLKRMNHSLWSSRQNTIKYNKYIIIKPNNVGEIVLTPTILLPCEYFTKRDEKLLEMVRASRL